MDPGERSGGRVRVPARLGASLRVTTGVPQAGHPFQLRCARSASSHARGKQEAPLFLLFLDCVWQLSRQFPFSLEFGEQLLLTLFDNAYASAYGTFLCNNERERWVRGTRGQTCPGAAQVTPNPAGDCGVSHLCPPGACVR